MFAFSAGLAILLSVATNLIAHPNYQKSFTTSANQYDDDQFYVDHDFILNQWTVEDGLPVNTTTKILKGQKGYFWIGTTDGLVRFDGIDFTVYKTAEYPGLPSNRIVDLKKAYDGTIWLGTDKGELVKFLDGEFKKMTSADGLNGNRYSSLYIDPNERLWVGTEKGISIYQDGELSQFHPHKIKGHIVRIYKGSGKIVWFLNEDNNSIYRFDGQQSTLVFEKDEGAGINPFLTLQGDGLLFAADKNIYRYTDQDLTNLDFPDYSIADLYQSANGAIFAATEDNGLYKLQDGSWVQKNEGIGWRMGGEVLQRYADSRMYVTRHRVYKDELLLAKFESRITGYYFDREDNLWVTTNRSGLIRLKPNPFTIYGSEEGLPETNINSIIQTSDGSIWIGTFGAGPVRLKDGTIKSLFDYQSLENGTTPEQKYVLSMLERNDGRLLMSILGHGIYRFDEKKSLFRQVKVPFSTEIREGKLDIRTLFEDSKNRLWAGTNYGLWMKQNETWHEIDINSGFDHPIRYITEAPDSSLWMATNGGGIIRYDNNDIEIYDENKGLSSNLIRSIYTDTTEDSSHYILYVGSEDLGLNRISIRDGEPQWETHTIFTENNGLYSNGVHQIIEDNRDRLWMSSNQGIFYVSKSELNKYSDGELSKVNSIGYNEKNGLRNREFNGGVQEAGIKASDGTLWFPSQEGVVTFDPSLFPRNTLPPAVVIEKLVSEEQNIAIDNDSLQLQANQRNFEINFTGFSFKDPESVQFRYRLKGFDDEWIETGTRRTAFYTNVPAGNYTFEVTASTNQQEWNPNPASLSIAVSPYFYETTTFYAIAGVTLVVLLIGALQLRTYRLKKREQKLEEAVQERSQQLIQEKIKTEKQAQELKRLNEKKNQFFTNITHELRTPLTLLVGPLKTLYENEDISMEAVRNQLEPMLRNGRRLQRLINQLLDLSRIEAGMVDLNAAKQSLSKFVNDVALEFSPMADVKNITFDVDIPEKSCEVYFDTQKLQKALSNLLSNAMKFTPENGRVQLQLSHTTNEATIIVKDTGIGIDQESLDNIFDRFYQVDSTSTRKNEGTGVGLAFAKELVELHEGSITVESTVGEGSVFTINLPKGRTHLSDEQITESAEPVGRMDETMLLSPRDLKEPPPSPTSDASDNDHPTLLVIDDNADIRSYVRTILGSDYAIIEAEDGKQGVEIAREQLPDLIICDVMMPEMDGFGLSDALKDNPMTEGIPLIFLTAKVDKQGELKGLDTGADAYITKPFDADILQARVENLLDQRKRLRKLFADDGLPVSTSEQASAFEERVTEVIQSHLTDGDFTVAQLADEVAMDRSHLGRKLKKELDVTASELIRDVRLKSASELLRKREGNISEVAYSVGFNSLSYFSRRFKEKYDVTPSAYLDKVT